MRVMPYASNKALMRLYHLMQKAYTEDDYSTYVQALNDFVALGEILEKDLLPTYEAKQREAHKERIRPKGKVKKTNSDEAA